MKATAAQRIISEEISQAVVRILLCLLGLIASVPVYFFNNTSASVLVTISGYIVVALFWWALVKNKSGDYPFRRRLIALSDLGIISFCMYSANEWGTIYFFAYLWVIVGNGMRFGARALIESTLIGFTYFVALILTTPYWIANPHVTIGLIIGLALLPAYYLILINRLSRVSKQLADELGRVNYSATHDSLSGLSNRAYFFQRLEDKINEANRHNENFIVMYIDLDGFKAINDSQGHNYGDIVLKEVAKRMQQYVRVSDTVSRLGGDEFALVIHTIREPFNLSNYTQRLIDKIAEPIIIDNVTTQVTASIGISQFPADGNNAETLLNSADQAMYTSKNTGRNRFTLANSSAHTTN